MNFYSFSAFLLLFAIFAPFSFFDGDFSLAAVGFGFVQFIFLILFCRSNIWVFNLSFTLISVFFELFVLNANQEASYSYVGHTFILIATILMITGDAVLTVLAGVVKVITYWTTFRNNFVVLIRQEEPEVFVDKFVKNIIFYFVGMLIVNVFLVKTLEKRTIQVSIAKNALEHALEQQKTFILSFSHELRNPINSLLGNLQLALQSEALSAKAKEMLNTAKVCGEILLQNINNVLDTGKFEIGKLEVNPLPTQLNELFQRTWGIYSELFRQKKLKSQLRIEKEIPPVVRIDSNKINQILLNLIGNSIKFTEKGSVSVTVKWLRHAIISDKCFEPVPYDDIDEGLFEKEDNLSMLNRSRFSESITGFLGASHDRSLSNNSKIPQHQPQQESQGILKVIVKDTGSGMKTEALEKLFQKFSQVSENVSHRNIGSGLGLFITKEICHAMNGEIRAYSKFHKGTTFVVCIPTISVPSSHIQRADSEFMFQQLSTRHLKAMVVDDSPFNVNLTCNYFAKFEASVVSVAYNGYDGFLKYKECRIKHIDINVVTLDIDMPVMDGRTACDKIREYERENRLRPALIIFISGNTDEEQVEEDLNPEGGRRADYFLRKPVSFSDFQRAVYSLIFRTS